MDAGIPSRNAYMCHCYPVHIRERGRNSPHCLLSKSDTDHQSRVRTYQKASAGDYNPFNRLSEMFGFEATAIFVAASLTVQRWEFRSNKTCVKIQCAISRLLIYFVQPYWRGLILSESFFATDLHESFHLNHDSLWPILSVGNSSSSSLVPCALRGPLSWTQKPTEPGTSQRRYSI